MSDSPFDFFKLLARYRIPFVIIGGHAVQFHGHLRSTEDIDLLWLRTPESEPNLLAALLESHACWISDERDPESGLERVIPVTSAYLQNRHLMMLTTDFGFVDVFDFVPGFPKTDLGEIFQDAVEVDGFRYVSLEWLRKMKQASGRLKDQIDLDNL